MFQFNRETQKKHFENHIAKLHDFGMIKILDFYNPKSSAYSIRFLFEEDNYRLHIIGDFGEIVAENYKNMCFELFGKDFIDNPNYFSQKIKICSRPLYEYDYIKAKKDLEEMLSLDAFETEAFDKLDYYEFQNLDEEDKERVLEEKEKELKNEVIEEVLNNYYSDDGITQGGVDLIGKYDSFFWECADNIGRIDTGIIKLYLLAFELATKQLNENKTKTVGGKNEI
jgi:hypothetical protein